MLVVGCRYRIEVRMPGYLLHTYGVLMEDGRNSNGDGLLQFSDWYTVIIGSKTSLQHACARVETCFQR